MLRQEQLGGGRVRDTRRSYRADFLVSPSATPGNERAKRIIVSSGIRCCELCGSSGPLGSLERMLLESSVWRSTIFLLIWKVRNTGRGHSIFQLEVLKRRTKGNGSSSLPTVTKADATLNSVAGKEYSGCRHALKIGQAINKIPTIRANERGGYQRDRGLIGKERLTVMGLIKSLPTVTSRDHKDTGNLENVPVNALLGRELGKNHGMMLQPAFAEWMQGFPIGWTELSASEIQSARSKSIRSSKPSQMLKKERKNP
jgi:hypothetical protein